MTIPDYDQTRNEPLVTDAMVQARVAQLVGRAVRRQLWFLYLDEDGVQLPLLTPFADPPPSPQGALDGVISIVGRAMGEVEAHSVVIVIERYGDAGFTPADRKWARALSFACSEADIRVRSLLVSHRSGVRWFAPDDYAFG